MAEVRNPDPLPRALAPGIDKDDTQMTERTFVWDGLSIAEERDATGISVEKRFYENGVQTVNGTQLANYFYTKDHLGSIREVTDEQGALEARYDYDPYGRVTQTAGTFESDFLFTGHFYHAKSGLHLAPYRAYNADLGRWLSRDPIEEAGGLNLYEYAANDPVNWVDLLGLIPGGPNPAFYPTIPSIHPNHPNYSPPDCENLKEWIDYMWLYGIPGNLGVIGGAAIGGTNAGAEVVSQAPMHQANHELKQLLMDPNACEKALKDAEARRHEEAGRQQQRLLR